MVTITGWNQETSGKLIIPAIIRGKPVTSVEDDTFAVCDNLTSITIPDSVTSIGDYAFYDCRGLNTVTFLGNAPKIVPTIFSGATPTIYRKPEAKGWGDTFGDRPVKLISEKP